MVFGTYYLTLSVEGESGEGRIFRHAHEVEHAFEEGKVALHAGITVRPSAGTSLYSAVAPEPRSRTPMGRSCCRSRRRRDGCSSTKLFPTDSPT